MAEIKLTSTGKNVPHPPGSTIRRQRSATEFISRSCVIWRASTNMAPAGSVWWNRSALRQKNLQASCMVEARNGMVIETNNAKVPGSPEDHV